MCFRPPIAARPIKCPKCGAINPVVAKVCSKCQTPLEEKKVDEGAKKG
ncbi:Zinc-ribbon domain [Moorella glycerini]|uniref:Zinc-ribbon domain-containing protein n=2 Tax=Neomoorella stamsii TaxID=1266720 RepID=A0A9X7P5P0_9FIRM|nr:hypothetical protein MOST_23830 [Moorella stamsii]CEP66578.1 Zinc-ribbon domain [Moorella glycerini]